MEYQEGHFSRQLHLKERNCVNLILENQTVKYNIILIPQSQISTRFGALNALRKQNLSSEECVSLYPLLKKTQPAYAVRSGPYQVSYKGVY